jgi:hypothetical protein
MLVRSSIERLLLTVRRRCLVCDYERTVEEPADTAPIGPLCADCHAPTERVETLRQRRVPLIRNAHAAELGRLGGVKGGPARARALTAERRREIATAAARQRWSRKHR